MNGDRLHDRKDPLPLSRGTAEPETGDGHHEPQLRAFGDEPAVISDTSLVVPADLRAAHQGRGSAPIIAIAAFVVFCACGGAYAYWKFTAVDHATPSAQITAPTAPATPAAAAAQPYEVTPPPTQPAAAVATAPPTPAPPAQAAPAKPTIDPAAAARRKVADEARRAAERAARERQAAEQAQREQAEKLRLAAIRHHEEKLRADRERKEAALRKVQQQRARQEQAVQEQIDQATAAANPAPQLPATPPTRRQQNADLPQTARGDGPPLDAGDLPPPATAAPENQ